MKKHTFSHAIDLHITNLKQAFSHSWKHPWLWIFGFFAAILQTGSVFSNIIGFSQKLRPAESMNLEAWEAYIGEQLPWVFQFFQLVFQQGVVFIVAITALFLLVLFAIFAVTILSQQMLFTANKESVDGIKRTWRYVKNRLYHAHFFQFLTINIGAILLLDLVLIIASIPLSFLLDAEQPIFYTVAIFTAFNFVFLPFAFIVQSFVMMMLGLLTRKELSLTKALLEVWKMLNTHFLFVFETALLLFAINVGVYEFVLQPLKFILLPSYLATMMSWYSGNLWLLPTGITLGASLLFVGILGFLTVFNYSMWGMVVDRAEKKTIISFLERVFSFRS